MSFRQILQEHVADQVHAWPVLFSEIANDADTGQVHASIRRRNTASVSTVSSNLPYHRGRRGHSVQNLAIRLIVTITRYLSQGLIQLLELHKWVTELSSADRSGGPELCPKSAVMD